MKNKLLLLPASFANDYLQELDSLPIFSPLMMVSHRDERESVHVSVRSILDCRSLPQMNSQCPLICPVQREPMMLCK